LSVVTDFPGVSTDVWMVASMGALTVALTVALMAVGPTLVSTVLSTGGGRAVKMAATDSVVNATDSVVNAMDSVGTAMDSVGTWTSTGYDRPSTDHRPLGHHRHRGPRGPLPWER
jgi:hypothetical protein